MKLAVLFRTTHLRMLIIVLASPFLLNVNAPVQAEATELGRLFYTPAQRDQLNAARARHAQPPAARGDTASDMPPAPVRYDGLVTRSDGKTIRWVDGKAQIGAAGVSDLKPGQVRANGQVYEPYQVLRPQLVEPPVKEGAP